MSSDSEAVAIVTETKGKAELNFGREKELEHHFGVFPLCGSSHCS